MNSYWQFNRFIKMHEEHLEHTGLLLEKHKRKNLQNTIVQISIIVLAIFIPIILTAAFSFISFLNLITIYILYRNSRRNKEFIEKNNDFLVSYGEKVKEWREMPNNRPELSYEEIMEKCEEQMHLLLDINTDTNKEEKELQTN